MSASEQEAAAAATSLREKHALGIAPIADLIPIVEAEGADVAVFPAPDGEHGMTMRDPAHGTVVILVAVTDNPMRQRSSLGHELAHHLFGDGVKAGPTDWARREPAERRADAFARHLLLPLAAVERQLEGRDATETDLSRLVQRYALSPAMASIQLEQVAAIDAATKAEWMRLTTPQLAARFGWSDTYAAWQSESRQRRAPQRLLARATVAYEQGLVDIHDIARLRGVSVETAESSLTDAGIRPRPLVPRTDASDLGTVTLSPADLAALDDLD